MKAETYAAVMAEFVVLSDADAETRTARLAELRVEDPERAATLERLLAAHDEEQSPLEAAPPALEALSNLAAPSRLPVPLGESLGGYRLESVLGQGGMGCVYLGVHEVLERRVAVKVLRSDLVASEEFVSRFLHEAKIVNEVNHDNVVDIFDFITTTEPPRVAFVMELLSAPSLQEVLRDHGPLTVRQARNAGLQLCDALRAVHARGVVHRDLKPDNLIVAAPLDSALDAPAAIKVLDFGIAKIARPDATVRTSTGAVLGTPAYMTPEQLVADPISPATDVYAVGEILFEMVTGRRLFREQGLELMSRKLADRPPDVAEVGHAGLAELIWGCVRPVQSDRLSLDALVARLEALSPEPERAGARIGWGAAAALAVVVGLASVGAVPLWGSSVADAPADPAEAPEEVVAPAPAAAPVPAAEAVPVSASEPVARPAAEPKPAPEPVAGPMPEAAPAPQPIAAPEPVAATEPAPAPAPQAAPTPSSRTPRARPVAPAPTPAEVRRTVPVRSEPSGATVRARASGRILGSTPFELELGPDEAVDLSVALEGYRQVDLTVTAARPPATVRLTATAIPIGETKAW